MKVSHINIWEAVRFLFILIPEYREFLSKIEPLTFRSQKGSLRLEINRLKIKLNFIALKYKTSFATCIVRDKNNVNSDQI